MLRVSKSRWAAQFTPGSRTTLRTRASLPPSDREYTPALSADKHLPEAHCLSCSILSPAVTATGTTFWADRWRHGWEKSLAGDDSEGRRWAISHRGEHGAACHEEPESEVENPGRTKGFYRTEGRGRYWSPRVLLVGAGGYPGAILPVAAVSSAASQTLWGSRSPL